MAQHPHADDAEAPERPRTGWLRFVRHFGGEVARDHVFMAAGSMAYFGFIALFPTLIAAVSLVGLFADPQFLKAQIDQVASLMPPGGAELLLDQARSIMAEHERTLGIGLLVSLAISLWGASNGAAALIEALHLVYDEEEDRGFLRARGVALLVAVASLFAFVSMAVVLVGVPHLLDAVPVLHGLATQMHWLRWGLLTLVVASFLATVYRFAPSRPLPSWRAVSWGSLAATLLWLAASWALSLYMEQASRFQEIYGALGGVVALLLWLYFGGLAVLLGAEVDATVAWAARGYRGPAGEQLEPRRDASFPSA